MVTNSKQNWNVGATVKIGFMTLTTVGKVPTPGDGFPDCYALQSAKGVYYNFMPHNGLVKCRNLAEAMEA